MKLVGAFIAAVATALGVGRWLRARRVPPSRDQVARNFRKIAKRADPVALEDFRRARKALASLPSTSASTEDPE